MDTALEGKTVMICEDEGTTIVYLRKLMEREGLRVVGTVSDGRQSVEEALRQRPDVVLMDINLPNMEGTEAVRRILGTYYSYRPCIVMITAYSEEERRNEALAAGAQGYVVKPFSSNTLIDVIARTLATQTREEGMPDGVTSEGDRSLEIPVSGPVLAPVMP